MTSGTRIFGNDSSVAAGVLGSARAHRREADAAEASLLDDVLAWAELHVTVDPDEAAIWPETIGQSEVRLGGPGCPWVREFTITELAAVLGLSPVAGRHLVAETLELAFRLPLLWGKVQAGTLQAWRARRVASRTQGLSVEAAGFVDRQVATLGNGVGVGRIEKLVDEAIGRFMPQLAEQERKAAEDRRFFDIHHDQPSFSGTARVDGEIGIADAMDLEAAIGHLAKQLKDQGSSLSLNERRAIAVGELARGQFDLTFDHDPSTPDQTHCAVAGEHPASGQGRREVVLYAHLSADALVAHSAHSPAGPRPGQVVVTLEGHGAQLITADTLREWLTIDDQVQVTVRPVLDLNANMTSTGRFPSARLREQLHVRDQTCAAPFCERPARGLDADHIRPWQGSTKNGPLGQDPPQTRSENLGSLCRHHHRAKTFCDWNYHQLHPGVFLWTSPHGYRFLTHAGQTIDLGQEATRTAAAA